MASDITPHRQLLDKVAGYDWLFPVGDTAALAARVTAALADEAKSRRLAQRAREFVRLHYSWPALADATVRCYRKIARVQGVQLA